MLKDLIEIKIADIGPGKKEYNVKTSKGWTNEEVEDKSKRLGFAATIKTAQAGGRIRPERKVTTPERRRVKAVGGGKTEPVQYKPRKDIGQQRAASTREQQPTQERGSADVRAKAAAAAKEERKKAALARIAAKKAGGAAAPAAKPKAKEVKATASKLLSTKKPEPSTPSDYKPQKASGLSTQERKALYKKGERTLRDIVLKATGKRSEKELKHKYTSK